MTSENPAADAGDRRAAAQAGRLLQTAWRAPVRVTGGEILKSGRYARVYRLKLADVPRPEPASVVLKRALPAAPAGRDAALSARQRLHNEWASLDFLGSTERTRGIAPGLIAGNAAQGLLLMHDLGEGRGLDAILMGEDAQAAADGLSEWARLLGRLHGAGLPGLAGFVELRAGMGDLPRVDAGRRSAALTRAVRRCAADLEVSWSAAVGEEIDALAWDLTAPSFQTLVHNDPCPDNVHFGRDATKLLDFAHAGPGHALTDGVYARMGFPSCWCVRALPESVCRDTDQAYRETLTHAIPEAGDDAVYFPALVGVCAFLVADMMLSGVPEPMRRWGTATYGQRFVSRCGTFADLSARHEHLTALGSLCWQLARRARSRWGAPASELPMYPAFETR